MLVGSSNVARVFPPSPWLRRTAVAPAEAELPQHRAETAEVDAEGTEIITRIVCAAGSHSSIDWSARRSAAPGPGVDRFVACQVSGAVTSAAQQPTTFTVLCQTQSNLERLTPPSAHLPVPDAPAALVISGKYGAGRTNLCLSQDRVSTVARPCRSQPTCGMPGVRFVNRPVDPALPNGQPSTRHPISKRRRRHARDRRGRDRRRGTLAQQHARQALNVERIFTYRAGRSRTSAPVGR